MLLAAAGGAQAYDHHRERDSDDWRDEHSSHDHRYEKRYVRERPVLIRERPSYVERERPFFVQPAPIHAAPMQMYPNQGMYRNQGPSGLNLNFNIPLN